MTHCIKIESEKVKKYLIFDNTVTHLTNLIKHLYLVKTDMKLTLTCWITGLLLYIG